MLIVEDEPAIALVHRRMVEKMPMFEVVDAVESAERALARMPVSRPDLILLDLSLPGLDGLGFLSRLRTRAQPVEVIAVTASRATDTARAMAHLGVLDYLIKPFSPDRMRQALGFFLRRMAALDAGSLDQSAVDALCANGRLAGRFLPKGLVEETLDAVRRNLEGAGCPRSAEQVAAAVDISRVTARRYLEYMLTTDQVSVESQGDGPGRPRRLYRPLAPA